MDTGASPGGDGGREADGDRALHRATSAVIGSCLVGLQQLRRHADRVAESKNDGVATVQSPSIFQVAESKKVIRELSRMTLSRTAGFTPVPFTRLGMLGGPPAVVQSAGALTVLERAATGSANRYFNVCRGRGKLSSIKFWIPVLIVVCTTSRHTLPRLPFRRGLVYLGAHPLPMSAASFLDNAP